ncbi:hypothetical protein SMACR_09081 [Sordaria macrospora]|uniref:WGS project CABT00000000 data, contig 2.71 n=2 Tax=Sordaria macrospora TaxID=5147 RepID=F7WB74_SORMK|nr:uncharacterized protein SMAC_09081 [Sordaria macrospora k-hell]KAA8622070.1 hypothetical protein SMACR_09081 [Sordaria macrospora]WPJ59518.1 hypothetical protein SMAC4_09081 [Sordaria macrospora]CCC05407.1 unnamed protein product [Sordaria macrospora k-hell]
MSFRIEKNPSKATAKRQSLLIRIEQFGSPGDPCRRWHQRSLTCKRLPDAGKCGEYVRYSRPCVSMDTDTELTVVLEERARVVQTKAEVLKNIQELAKKLAQLEQEQERLSAKSRELTERSMAELEALEAEERAEEQAQTLSQGQAAGVPNASVSSFDWSSLDVSDYPAAWLGSPAPLGDPGSSGGIPPTSQGNSNS